MNRITTLMATTALALGIAASASAQTGRPATPGAQPPEMTRQMAQTGRLCRVDTSGLSMWWSEAPGGRHTVHGADGNCRTVPAVVRESATTLLRTQAMLRAMGYPVVRGDAAPRFHPQPAAFRRLQRMGPEVRARTMSAIPRETRGRMLASFTVPQRRAVSRGLPHRLRALMAQDLRLAQAGRPRDFIGASRRLDVVLTADSAAMPDSEGYADCRGDLSRRGADRFVGTSMVVLTDGSAPSVSTLAHEFFHAVQCNLGMGKNALLAMEGTADWASARLQPAAFAGPVIATADGRRWISGGSVQAMGFCQNFDPTATASDDPYLSFAVWAALEADTPGLIRRTLTAAATRPLTTPTAVMDQIGDARWSRALATATSAVCGELRVPGSPTRLPAEARGFIGGGGPAAGPGGAVSISVPAGGVRSAGLNWSQNQAAPTFLIASPQMTPAALAGQLVANTRTAPLVVTPTADGVLVVIPPERVSDGSGSVTVASPSIGAPFAVTITMIG